MPHFPTCMLLEIAYYKKMQIYKVGGAVRDKLLKRSVTDVDWVVVGALPEDMIAQGFRQVGKDFPVFLHPDSHEEYALARKERKIAPGYKGFQFDTSKSVTLEEDLLRRDITINAMAEDDQGQIIDPYNGQADLQNKIIRHVSSAFSEDPVRVLRVARFAARFDFQIANETMQLMKAMVDTGEVNALVAERVWAELDLALAEEYPQRFFGVLRECGALAIIFPEIDRLFGVPQTKKYHPEVDTGVHTMMVLQQAVKLTDNKSIRFAALVHDLGKGTTPTEILPSHHGHEQRSVELIKSLCARIRVPNDYRDLALMVARYHSHCHRIQELKPSTILNTLEAMDVFRRPDRFYQFLIACEADAKGRTGKENDQFPQAGIFRAYMHATSGIDAKSLIEEGMNGTQIAQALRKNRLGAIREIMESSH